MTTTYRAVQAIYPGRLELVERQAPAPGDGEVLLDVEACGVCGADAADIERAGASPGRPRVPGHEVVGRIAALGPGVSSMWSVGQRVGVGRLGGHCGAGGTGKDDAVGDMPGRVAYRFVASGGR